MTVPGQADPRIARGFDRLAPLYDVMADMAFFGRIHASQTILLPRLPRIQRALVLGGGTGRFMASFLNHDPSARAVSIDASAGMTKRTADRLAGQGLRDRVELRVGGLETLGRDERFDLVVTHCFLDLFEEVELERVVDAIDRALEPRGHWLFSDFDLDLENPGGLVRRSIIATLYAFFDVTCALPAKRLPDFDRAFDRKGLQTRAETRLGGGILRAALLQKPT